MKKIIILAILLTSCNPPAQLPTSGDITVIQNVGSGSNSGTGSNPDTCLPVERVRIVAFPTSLGVGESARIDVTPKDSFGNNRSDNCNEATGNHWDSDDSVCAISQASDFVSSVKGIKAGTCEITACVAGKCDSVKFPVV